MWFGWQLMLNYMRTPPTHYYLESSGQATYMKTHPKYTTRGPLLSVIKKLSLRVMDNNPVLISITIEFIHKVSRLKEG